MPDRYGQRILYDNILMNWTRLVITWGGLKPQLTMVSMRQLSIIGM